MSSEDNSTSGDGLRLRSITIHSLRAVRPETKLEFSNSMNVVLGENATGKSTLLELISACVRGDFTFFAKEVFDVEFDLSWKRSQWTYHVRNVELDGDDPVKDSRFRGETIVRGSDPETGRHEIQFDGGPPIDLLAKQADNESSRIGKLGYDSIRSIGLREIRELYCEFDEDGEVEAPQHTDSTRFREGLEWLARQLSSSNNYINWTSHGGSAGAGFSIAALFNLKDIMSLGSDVLSPIVPVVQSKIVGMAVQEAGFDRSTAIFNPAEETNSRFRATLARFVFERARTRRLLDDLSYGQRRLFSLAWYMALSPDILVIDEMVNGLHERWVEWCVRQFGNRQVFVTSQNRVLVDLLPFSSEHDLRVGVKRCTVTREPDGDQWHWESLTEFEADTLTRALRERHTDFVSEALRVLHLW